MRISTLELENYRSIDKLSLSFPAIYTAICGKNNAGKTNILKAIRTISSESDGPYFEEDENVNFNEDYPFWKKSGEKTDPIRIIMTLIIYRDADPGLFSFVEKFYEKRIESNSFSLRIASEYFADKTKNKSIVQVDNEQLQDFNAQEVLQKIKTSRLIVFHNSTDSNSRFYFRRRFSTFFTDLSSSDRIQIDGINKQIKSKLNKLSKQQQERLSALLGRLEDKYQVSLSAPSINLDHLPFQISLSDKSVDIPLDDWGSGTKNRTLILLQLFRAKQGCDCDAPTKITPCVIVEEPESFLHPSAQAEFGRLIQSLAEEFGIQLIVNTHSPYMLSQNKPDSNVLLYRKETRGKFQNTEKLDVSGDKWMEPFAMALGIVNEEFEPWKDCLFANSNSIILVEGEIDKEYLQLLKDEKHGKNALKFDGEIFACGGKDTLKNTVLINFIKNKYAKYLITFDLDAEQELTKNMTALGLSKGKDYIVIGQNISGKKNIEGLLPNKVLARVNSENSDLISQAINGNTEEKRSAKSKLKQLLLEAFKSEAKPGNEYFKEFYTLSEQINKIMKNDARPKQNTKGTGRHSLQQPR